MVEASRVAQAPADEPQPGRLPQRLALIAVTRRGAEHCARLRACWPQAAAFVSERWAALAGPGSEPVRGRLEPVVADLFRRYDGLVFFTAVGVAVRLTAPSLRSKYVDPAVVAVDEGARYAVSVLSGHLGGGNALAVAVGVLLGAQPILTTASDACALPAVDLLGQAAGWRPEEPSASKQVSAALVNGEPVGWVQDATLGGVGVAMPAPFCRFADLFALAAAGQPGVVVSERAIPAGLAAAAARWLVYRPPTLVLGVGASTGATAAEIEALARQALDDAGLAWKSLALIGTLDRKLAEPGLVAFAAQHGLPLQGYSAAELSAVAVPHPSAAVAGHVGTPSVCEAAALLAAGGPLLVGKRKGARATVAVARRGTA